MRPRIGLVMAALAALVACDAEPGEVAAHSHAGADAAPGFEVAGDATNCSLATGCPVTATLGGIYDPVTQHIHGQLKEAAIDYSLVIVYAEGEFDGDLTGGSVFDGSWSGDKTDIDNLALPAVELDWVTASGEGSWTAEGL